MGVRFTTGTLRECKYTTAPYPRYAGLYTRRSAPKHWLRQRSGRGTASTFPLIPNCRPHPAQSDCGFLRESRRAWHGRCSEPARPIPCGFVICVATWVATKRSARASRNRPRQMNLALCKGLRWCRGPDLNWRHRDFQSRADRPSASIPIRKCFICKGFRSPPSAQVAVNSPALLSTLLSDSDAAA